jgi:putative hydrolase of the HAD superfamily
MLWAKNIGLVLFDPDKVIINPHWEFFSTQYEKQAGLTKNELSSFFTWDFDDCLKWRRDLRQILPFYLKDRKWKWTVDEFLDVRFKAEHSVDERLIQDVYNLQQANIPCGLATNQERHRLKYIRNAMWFDDIFGSDYIFASVDFGCKKNEDGFFPIIETRSGISMDQMLLVDDDKKNIDAAARFGVQGYHYQWYTENFQNVLQSILEQ